MLSAGNKAEVLCKARTAIASQKGKKESGDRKEERKKERETEGNIIYPHPSVWGRTAVV